MGKLRPQTIVLFSLFLVSVGILLFLQSQVKPQLWYYEIDPAHGSISSCQNSAYEISKFSRLLKNAETQFARVSWDGDQLRNRSYNEVAACSWLPGPDEFPRQMRCLEFPAQATKSSERFVVFFDSEQSCWDQRDLNYVIQIDRLVEENSPEYWWRRITSWLQSSPKSQKTAGIY